MIPITKKRHLEEEESVAQKKTCLPSNTSFMVTKVANKKLQEIRDELAIWEETAYSKRSEAQEEEALDIFHDLTVVTNIFNTRKLPVTKKHSYFVCKSEQFPKTIQAIAITQQKKSTLFLEALITNPHNVRSSVNEDEPEKTRGAGSALINHIVDRCLKKDLQKISLSYLTSSVPFYKAHGFTEISSNKLEKDIKSI